MRLEYLTRYQVWVWITVSPEGHGRHCLTTYVQAIYEGMPMHLETELSTTLN